jgi:hypothetical protein
MVSKEIWALVATADVEYEEPNTVFKHPVAADLLLFISLSFMQIL